MLGVKHLAALLTRDANKVPVAARRLIAISLHYSVQSVHPNVHLNDD